MPRPRRAARLDTTAQPDRHSAHRPRRATTPPTGLARLLMALGLRPGGMSISAIAALLGRHECTQAQKGYYTTDGSSTAVNSGAIAALLGRHSAHRPRRATTPLTGLARLWTAVPQPRWAARLDTTAQPDRHSAHRPRRATTPPTGLARLLMALGLRPRRNVHRGAIAALLGRHSAHRPRRATTPLTGLARL